MTAPVVLITGAARRIGAELARTFHTEGYSIALHYNQSADEAHALADQLNQQRANSAAIFQAELADVAAIQKMAEKVQQWQGRLDVLINNASSFYPTPLANATEADWNNLIDSNLKGPYFLCQALAETLNNNNGCIINIADMHARQPLKNYSIYCIAKAGNLMLTKSLARELAPKVRVNGISPGTILWPENDNVLDGETQQKVLSRIALARTGSPEDIAAVALFLAREANYITGQTIAVDGG